MNDPSDKILSKARKELKTARSRIGEIKSALLVLYNSLAVLSEALEHVAGTERIPDRIVADVVAVADLSLKVGVMLTITRTDSVVVDHARVCLEHTLPALLRRCANSDAYDKGMFLEELAPIRDQLKQADLVLSPELQKTTFLPRATP